MGLSEQRKAHLDHARRFSRGTMPIAVAVEPAELAAAAAYLRGRKWGALIELRAIAAKGPAGAVERGEVSPLPKAGETRPAPRRRAA